MCLEKVAKLFGAGRISHHSVNYVFFFLPKTNCIINTKSLTLQRITHPPHLSSLPLVPGPLPWNLSHVTLTAILFTSGFPKSSANLNHHLKWHWCPSSRKNERAFCWKWRMISYNSGLKSRESLGNGRGHGTAKALSSQNQVTWDLTGSQSAFLISGWNPLFSNPRPINLTPKNRVNEGGFNGVFCFVHKSYNLLSIQCFRKLTASLKKETGLHKLSFETQEK